MRRKTYSKTERLEYWGKKLTNLEKQLDFIESIFRRTTELELNQKDVRILWDIGEGVLAKTRYARKRIKALESEGYQDWDSDLLKDLEQKRRGQ